MARVSFTLRRDVIDRGSYVRYDTDTYNAAASIGNAASAGTWEWDYDGSRDVDSSLRSDGYVLPAAEFAESFFEATAVSYGVNALTWGVNLYPLSDSVLPYEIVLVQSYEGSPETIDSGTVLVESDTTFSYDHTGVTQGIWSYYSLFVRYRSLANPTGYYDKVATLEVINPVMYGSTTLLWERIPQYYRELDIETGEDIDDASYSLTDIGVFPEGTKIGPLYRFLSVFGFEMDRVRTLIDYLMVSKDPYESNTENLEAISNMMGLYLSPTLYSGTSIRRVLDDIGYLRRSKGSYESLRLYGRALSGCDIEIDETNQEVTFYAERTNYITDPLDATGLISPPRAAHEVEAVPPRYNMGGYDPTTYDVNDTDTYPQPLGASYAPGMYWTASASATDFNGFAVDSGDYIVAYLDGAWPTNADGNKVTLTVDDMSFAVSGYTFSSTKYSAYTIHTQSGTRYTSNGSGDSVGVTHLMFRIDCPVPVKEGDSLFFSMHSGVGTEHLVWARMTDESGNVMGESNRVVRSEGLNYIEVPITDNASLTEYTVGFIEFLVDLSAAGSFDATYFLAERNNVGSYFDGNNYRGGWLIDTVTTPGTSILINDYDWSDDGEPDPGDSSTYQNGDPYVSISVYTENYSVKKSLLSNYFLGAFPVNVADDYSIVDYNAVPGMDAIDAYFFSLP